MYTLGAALGVAATWAAAAEYMNKWGVTARQPLIPLLIRRLPYALAAALGLYTLYYFAFLLIPLSLWALWRAMRAGRVRSWLVTHAAIVVLYAPWLALAWRQATQPPVPPWRTAPHVLQALTETWQALALGQSAPAWLWPALLVTLVVYGLGIWALTKRQRSHAILLVAATLGPLALILGLSFVTPLYHVRYMFTYSPALYIVLAAGFVFLVRRWRVVAAAVAVIWLVAAGVTVRTYWYAPLFRPDDHRVAVRELRGAWRPGDVVLVNAGWAYTALMTYWDGPTSGRYRITGALPEDRADDALVMVTTGHVDGDAGLGWGDPRSDFFAMPTLMARQQTADLFARFGRVWHYRIYDTVNDPGGLVRDLLETNGRLITDHTYVGEAFLRVEAYLPRLAAWPADLPRVTFADGLELAWRGVDGAVESGTTLYTDAWWRASTGQTARLATSLRLVGPDGVTWAQPPDESPLWPGYTSVEWQAGDAHRQGLGLPIPQGTPPGAYDVVLVAYDADNGLPLATGSAAHAGGVVLGRVNVVRPATLPAAQPALAQFGPLALVEASTPATIISPGDTITVDLMWQARAAPLETLVVVTQLLRADDSLAANHEAQPGGGSYGTAAWVAAELVRDRQTLTLPADLPAGDYELIVGLYRAADGERLLTRRGVGARTDHWTVKQITIR